MSGWKFFERGDGWRWGSFPAASDQARVRLKRRDRSGILCGMTDEPRPSYADTLEAQMIADYVSSGQTLVDACRWLGVEYFGIFKKLRKDERFAELMNGARAAGADVIASNNRRIMMGEEGFSTGDWKRDRWLVETNFKLLAKWHPKEYGEKVQIEQKTATVAIPPSDDPIAAQKAYEELMKG